MTLLIGQFLIYGLAWVVGAWLLRDGRRPVLWWCAYCLLQAAGLVLITHQRPEEGAIGPTAAIVMLCAYTSADLGIDLFANGRLRWRGLWLALLAGGVALQLLALPLGLPSHLRGVGYNLGVALLLLGPMVVLHRPLQREFGLWGLLPLVPGALICLLALLRSAAILADPSIVAAAPRMPLADNPPMLLATLAAAGAFNISFIGLVIGRLVLRLSRRLGRDALTDLANRGGLEKHLAAAWAASRRHDLRLSIAFIDIDDFKQINDNGGHEAGDRVLRAVADALQLNARLTDQVGRWGGDEFMVVMPHNDQDAAAQAMQRLRERVLEAGIELPPGCAALSLSIGIATDRRDDSSVHALVKRADAEMYRIKRARSRARPAGSTPQPRCEA